MLAAKQKIYLVILMTLASLIWPTFLYSQQTQPLLHNSLLTESSVSAEIDSDSLINTSDAEIYADIKMKFPVIEYKSQLGDQKQLLQTRYKNSDLVERIVLERELTLLDIKIDRHDELYPDKIELLIEVYHYLNKVRVVLPIKETGAAKTALLRGDIGPAYGLIAQIEFHKSTSFEPELVLRAASAASLRGKIAEDQLDYLKAYRHYRRAVMYIPNNVSYLLAAGRIASKIALYNNAINFYESALPLLKKKELKKKELEQKELTQKNTKQKKLQQQIVDKNDDMQHELRQIWVDLGIAWNSKGNADRAIKYFNSALNSDLKQFGPKHANVASDKNSLGWAWETKGEFQKAIGFYRQAYQLNLSNLGATHVMTVRVKENLDAAIELLETSAGVANAK